MVGTQVDDVRAATKYSNVSEYGRLSLRSDPLSFYQGTGTGKSMKLFKKSVSEAAGELSIDSREASLFAIKQMSRRKGVGEVAIDALVRDYTKKRDDLTTFVKDVVKAILGEAAVGDPFEMKLPTYSQNSCHSEVIRVFDQLCAPLGPNPFAFKFSIVFANLCEITQNQDSIINYFKQKCQSGPLFDGVI